MGIPSLIKNLLYIGRTIYTDTLLVKSGVEYDMRFHLGINGEHNLKTIYLGEDRTNSIYVKHSYINDQGILYVSVHEFNDELLFVDKATYRDIRINELLT